MQFGFIGLFFALVILCMGFSIGSGIYKTPFRAYTDGERLFVDYIKTNDLYRPKHFQGVAGPSWERKQYAFPIKQIVGYKLHSFFGRPSVLELQLAEVKNNHILAVVIKIDSPSRKEAAKLILFLENIIPHRMRNQHKRLKGKET